MQKVRIYPIGSFANDEWRDEFIEKFPEYQFDDPRNHIQSSIVKLDYTDMNSAMTCPISLVYLPEGERAGTMSYCELGGSRAMGNSIIAIDGNQNKDSLIKEISSHYLTSRKSLYDLLKYGQPKSKFGKLIAFDKTSTDIPYKSILFTGDLEQMRKIMDKMSGTKQVYKGMDLNELENFVDKIDLIVVNFDEGKPHNKEGLFFMGLGYALDVPILELEGNVIPYPPVVGLARRILIGNQRFEHAERYLQNLSSQHIKDEVLVYYDLMEKFNN